jgi:methyl-accepting chemotaxis protein
LKIKMSLSKKLYGVTVIILATLVIISAITYFTQDSVDNEYREILAINMGQRMATTDALEELGRATQAFRNHLIRGDDATVKAYHEITAQIGDCIDRFDMTSQTDAERDLVKKARDELVIYDRKMDVLVALRKRINDPRIVDQKAGEGHTRGIRVALIAMNEAAERAFDQKNRHINAFASRIRYVQIALVLFAVLIGLALSTWTIRGIIKSVREVKATADFASKGDLSKDIMIHTDDEIGDMAKSFNTMIANLRRIIGEINTTTSSLAISSEELSATSDNMSKGANELSSQTEQVVTAMTEVSQTILDMAKNASSAADGGKNASETAANGKKIVDRTAGDMGILAKTVQEAAGTIEELGRSSAQIGEIVQVINGIADQTNLLALNAAIEAARAGDQGRGFAVVADEVRKLAERTAQATKDIAQRIASIQTSASESVDAMKRGSDEVDKGVKLANEASASLDTIVLTSATAMDMVQRIAAATEQQSAAVEEVSQNMEHIADITKQSSASTEQIKVSAFELAKLASNLKSMTAWFKV